jgi:hypothetical protein
MALLALWLTGCGIIPIPVPPPRPGMLTDDATARSITPLARLGRWDGTRFVEVTEGSLPPSTLRVLVHGWTPGWDREAVQEAGGRTWDLRSPTGRPFEPWMGELAEMIVTHDPHAVVVAYSWADGSSTVPRAFAQRRALERTDVYAEILAEALERGLSTDFYARNGRMQLIGHSYGARVAAVAATHLATPPAQLTLFDAPDGLLVEVTGSEVDMPSVLERLPIGWGRGRVFVDNYVSMIGRRYAWRDGLGGVRDVSLAPPFGQLSYRRRHLYPMRFYAESAGHGFGYDWSPLTGRTAAPDAGCWEQRVAGYEALTLGCTGVP